MSSGRFASRDRRRFALAAASLGAIVGLALLAGIPGSQAQLTDRRPGCSISHDDSYACWVTDFQPRFLGLDATTLSLKDDEVWPNPAQFPFGHPFGFDFTFYGIERSGLFISSNGFLTFDRFSGHGCCKGDPVPVPTPPNDLVACGWEDLDPSAGGTVRFDTIEEPLPFGGVRHLFVLEYNAVPYFGSSATVDFQIILTENPNPPPPPLAPNDDAFCMITFIPDDGDRNPVVVGTESPLVAPDPTVQGVRYPLLEMVLAAQQVGVWFEPLPPEILP